MWNCGKGKIGFELQTLFQIDTADMFANICFQTFIFRSFRDAKYFWLVLIRETAPIVNNYDCSEWHIVCNK